MNHPLPSRWLAAAAFVLLLAVTACGARYEFARVADFVVVDGDFYVLAVADAGVDRASRLAHSAALQPTRRVVAIARCALREGRAKLEVVGAREITDTRLLAADVLRLAAPQTCLAITGDGILDALSLSTPAQPGVTREVGRFAMTPNQARLVVPLDPPLVVEAAGLTPAPVSPKGLAALGARWPRERTGRVAVAGDLSVAAIQEQEGAATLLRLDAASGAATFSLPDGTFKIQSVHATPEGPRLLAVGLNPQGRELAALFDGAGREIGRREITGSARADEHAVRIVSVAAPHFAQLSPGEPLQVQVWEPAAGRSYTVSIDLAPLLAALR